jgi:hypothetical protein
MWQAPAQEDADGAEPRISVEQDLEGIRRRDAEPHQKLRRCRRERAGRRGQRTNESIASEHAGALLVGRAAPAVMFERHQHAEIAGRRIDAAEAGDDGDQRNAADIGKRQPGRRHQRRAQQRQRA